MKTKITFFAVLTVTLVAALIIGCNVLSDDTSLIVGQKEQQDEQSGSDGLVKVRFNIGNSKSNARTVLPDLDKYNGTDPSVFEFFLLKVFNYNTHAPIDISLTPFDGYFEYDTFEDEELTGLANGRYVFLVVACDSDGGTMGTDPIHYLAWGTDDVTISGTDVEVTIELKEIVGNIPSDYGNYNGTGTFAWYPKVGAYTTALLTFAPINDQTNLIIDEKDLKSNSGANNDGSDDTIPSGYYVMILELGNGDNYQTVFVREIVHIYSGFTSTYAPAAGDLPTLRSKLHTVTFNYTTDGAAGTRPLSQTISHGGTFGTVLSTSSNATPGNINDSTNYYFDGWYYNYDNITFTNLLVATDLVLKPTTLYAKWTEKDDPIADDFDVTGSMSQKDDNISAISIAPIAGKSDGTVTVKYNGSSTTPTTAGSYVITFDVAASTKWREASGLVTGQTLVIDLVPTPTIANYTIGNNTQTEDNTGAVTISPIGNAGGVSNIQYTGTGITNYPTSGTRPTGVGTYNVSFNTAAVSGTWKATTLSFTLTITEVPVPTLSNYTIENNEWTVGKPKTITITPKGNAGVASNIQYSGSSTLPTTIGIYNLTFDTTAVIGSWKATTLTFTLTIKEAKKFDISLVYSNLPEEPTFVNNSQYYESSGDLDIEIVISNDYDYDSIDSWYVDFINSAQSVTDGNKLKLSVNAKTTLGWSVPGNFEITIWVYVDDVPYDAKYLFKPIP